MAYVNNRYTLKYYQAIYRTGCELTVKDLYGSESAVYAHCINAATYRLTMMRGSSIATGLGSGFGFGYFKSLDMVDGGSYINYCEYYYIHKGSIIVGTANNYMMYDANTKKYMTDNVRGKIFKKRIFEPIELAIESIHS